MPDTHSDEQKSAFVATIKKRLQLPATATAADVLSVVDGIRARAASLSSAQVARAAASLTPDEAALFAEVYGDTPQPSALSDAEAALYASIYTSTGDVR